MQRGNAQAPAATGPGKPLDNRALHTHTDPRKLVWHNEPVIPLVQ